MMIIIFRCLALSNAQFILNLVLNELQSPKIIIIIIGMCICVLWNIIELQRSHIMIFFLLLNIYLPYSSCH